MNIVIFSKDRACQLEACIESLMINAGVNATNISVIYLATTELFEHGYELCRTVSPGSIKWVRQSFSFKKDLLSCVDPTNPLTMFLVDDIMFKEPFLWFDKEMDLVKHNKEILALSLRLDKNITHCYATNQASKVPSFVKGNVWKWPEAEGDWAYPYSVDGNIYRTDFILPKLELYGYNNPNELEAMLNSNNASLVALGTPGKPEYMACYVNGSKLVNIPANRVQNAFQNRHGNIITADEINIRFINGENISQETVKNLQNTTVHAEIPYIWEKRQ